MISFRAIKCDDTMRFNKDYITQGDDFSMYEYGRSRDGFEMSEENDGESGSEENDGESDHEEVVEN